MTQLSARFNNLSFTRKRAFPGGSFFCYIIICMSDIRKLCDPVLYSLVALAISAGLVVPPITAATGGTIFRSTDSGGTWNPVSVIAAAPFSSLGLDPTNTQTIYAAADHIYKTTDGGVSWNVLTGSPPANSLAVDPNNACVLYADAKFSSDCGTTWLSVGAGYFSASHFGSKSIAAAKTNPTTLYVAADGTLYFNSTPVSGGLMIWNSVRSSAYINLITGLDPSDGCTLYVGSGNGRVYRTPVCPALLLNQVGPNLPSAVDSLAVHPTDQVTVYAGTDDGGVYKYVANPSPAWVLLTKLDGKVGAIAIDRSNASVLYAGTSIGSVYKSSDGGTTWTRTSLVQGPVNAILVSSNSILAATASPNAAPAITSVVNDASFTAGGPISTGSWVAIFGTGLAPAGDSRKWNEATEIVNGKLPVNLDGTSVTVNGKPAVVEYIQPSQVNIQPPDDTALGPVQVIVNTAAGATDAFMVNNATFAPGLFPAAAPYIVAQHADNSYVTTAAPAKPGEVIILWGTGFGPANPAVPAGQVFSGTNRLANAVTVAIGGQPAAVDFAGVVGAGLVQINVHVPSSIGNGDAGVVASVGGVSTQTTANMIPIHN